jgi:hypothetical protein
MIYSDKAQANNNIDFEIKHLDLKSKRKEIQKYNPLHYLLGYTLVSKPWLTYEEMYANSD